MKLRPSAKTEASRIKLGIGTVQFGLDYGVSNTAGKTSLEEAREILCLAAAAGLTVIDTARAYGDSEVVIGRALPAVHGFRIVTKTPEIEGTSIDAGACNRIRLAFEESLSNLRCREVYGLLVHGADDLFKSGAGRLMDTLCELRGEGRVRKVGVSVYDARQIDFVLEHFSVDVIQLPLNILDQRLLRSGHLSRLAAKNVEIHARSAFLQGLLLMKKGMWPERFRPFFPLLQRFHELAAQSKQTPLQMALGFVQGVPEVSHVICGVNNSAQLRELLEGAASALDPSDLRSLSADDLALVDPSRWAEQSVYLDGRPRFG